ncbi:MAG TPA: HD domain-containing protein [Chitinophagaceae bacterium]|nr:HD domain-containing protein [Chitinophagaceae bacterium]
MFLTHPDYKNALNFAAAKHNGQKLPGTDLPYLVHVVDVAMEVMIAGFHSEDFDTNLAVTVALLHDAMEDTDTSYKEVKSHFNEQVADAVLALTKFMNLEKKERMNNSLQRIKELQKEVWAVKLADRITNLSAPALDWSYEKRKRYMDGSVNILNELSESNAYLTARLKATLEEYAHYVETGVKQ